MERTFSEYKAGKISKTLVSDYRTLPADLQVPGGALDTANNSAQLAGQDGNYADGTPRYFSCQTCHLHPVTGKGATQGTTRNDLPLHDMTGGNYWMPEALKYLSGQNKLVLGSPLSQKQIAGLNDGAIRAQNQLNMAASLSVTGNTLKVINLCGHKLISGYPEGRRMWLNIKWYNAGGNLIREDGKYGPLFDASGKPVTVPNPAGGPDIQVESIIQLHPDQTDAHGYGKIYEIHPAITQEWANQLLALHPANLALSYDRYTGLVDKTLGDVASQLPGTYYYTFHFVLNNKVASDNRIPPYGMSYDDAVKRNILPVPSDQYGNPGPSGVYNYWDEITLNPPTNAVRADISLFYQPTSWEYIQFLYLANNGQGFLGQEGVNMLEAWLNNRMSPPHVMATTTWTAP